MKYYKNYIAAALCFAMLTSTGCSLGKKNSSSSGIADFSYTSDSCEKYDLDNFSFELNKDFSVIDTSKNADGNDIKKYTFSGDGIEKLSISDYTLYPCAADVSVQSLRESIDSNENDDSKDVETETLDIPGFDAAEIHLTHCNDGLEVGESNLYLSIDGFNLTITAFKYDPGDRAKIKSLLRDIAATVKYTGNEQRPTEQQTYDSEFFSLNCGPEWYIKDMRRDKNDNEYAEIKLSYYFSKDMEHYMSPTLWISVEPDYAYDYGDPKKLADDWYTSQLKSKLSSEVERGTEEILGYNAETVSYISTLSGTKEKHTSYIFYDNGYVYAIGETLNMRDEEGSKAELKAIIDTINIHRFTEEEIEERNKAREALVERTFRGVSYKLPAKFSQLGESDESSNAVSFIDDGLELSITMDEYESKLSRAKQATQNSMNYDGYDIWSTKNVKVGSKEMICVIGINNEDERRNEVYLIKSGEHIWRFGFDFDDNKYEENKGIVEKFFESLDLSNAE